MKTTKKGFTLLEILLVVAAISILAGIVIVAINPGKQLADTRNAQRRVDINTIANALYQYQIDKGSMPAGLPAYPTYVEICRASATYCTGLVDLVTPLVSGYYLGAIPVDPLKGLTTYGSGYEITYNATSGRVTIRAPKAERNVTIQITK